MYYFPVAGRGETIKLICAAGGIELNIADGGSIDKAEFGSPSGLPVFQHGDLKISQSGAIETYVSFLAFPDLTPPQRAKDSQLCFMKEDALAGTAKVLFNPELKAKAAEELPPHFNKWYPVFESLLPDDGFINGLPYPTAADLAVLNVCRGFMPFGAGYKLANFDLEASYPKLVAHANRVAAVPSIEAYLAKSESMTGNPFGF